MKKIYIRSFGRVSSVDSPINTLDVKKRLANARHPERAVLVPSQDFRVLFPPNTLRRMDYPTIYLLVSGWRALLDLPLIEDSAICIGNGWGSTEPLLAILKAIIEDGQDAINPALFPYSVSNAPASALSIHFKFKGPNITICQKESSGIGSLFCASKIIQMEQVNMVLAGSVDYLDDTLFSVYEMFRCLGSGIPNDKSSNGYRLGEGAYTFLLTDNPDNALGEIVCTMSCNSPSLPHKWPENIYPISDMVVRLIDKSNVNSFSGIISFANGDERLDNLERKIIEELKLENTKIYHPKETVGEFGGSLLFGIQESILSKDKGTFLAISAATGGCCYGIIYKVF